MLIGGTVKPKGKLDTMTAYAYAVAMAALGVNGPEGEVPGWDAINWRVEEDNVRRLRQRIFAASRDGLLPTREPSGLA